MENISEKEILHEKIADGMESREMEEKIHRKDIQDFEYVPTADEFQVVGPDTAQSEAGVVAVLWLRLDRMVRCVDENQFHSSS